MERIALAERGAWQQLAESALTLVRVHQSPPTIDESQLDEQGLSDAIAEKVIKRIRAGAGLHSWQITRSAGLAPVDDSTILQASQKLVPRGDALPPLPRAPPRVSWQVPDEHFRIAHSRLRPGKAFDPGGWTHESWQILSQSMLLQPRLYSWYRTLFQLPDNHRLLSLLAGHRLALLRKSSGSDKIRPIVISSVARKVLHSAVCQSVTADLLPGIAAMQYGLCTSSGSAAMIANMQDQLPEHPLTAFAHIDIQNAFGES